MALLGNVIKKGISLTQKLSSEKSSPEEQQHNQLMNLLDKSKNTAFGKYHGFKAMLASENTLKAFQNEVPIVGYDAINENWWQQQRKYPDITWPGRPDYFALSSGTTGKESKSIPMKTDLSQ